MRREGADRRRRRLLGGALLAAAWAAGLRPRPAGAYGNMRQPGRGSGLARRFSLAQLRYAGDWDPEPGAAEVLAGAIERATSVEVRPGRAVLALGDDALFTQPLLWVAGRGAFPPLAGGEVERLRSWLDAGGTLVADDGTGVPGSPFDADVRRELSRVYPDASFARLPADHTVFKSFFLVRSAAGRTASSPFLEGITLRGRTSVLLSANDLFGAWGRDALGGWTRECRPGGERQRQMSLRLGVNIALYALSGDYKQDRIHEPFIRQRS